ncbi:hypothetical protein [Clostridium tyrobutyricum]|jgi:hypothetical protein|uniref:hypothetical protein n=1 Tax=Clostridium tyrobutyricum TaxID=1519 RepID=UPI0010AB4418|nr:hypothetical protein [Clostridium tyrobutyricum]MBV4429682.1 hypothetical protein [Clostridium tyrobutyricum]MBV4444935.1 hypothetical protein [Clostridium tyrobutyricum]QCH29498.1 hypothetical protein EZN00_03132 [Clostridium tyrobutyricum]
MIKIYNKKLIAFTLTSFIASGLVIPSTTAFAATKDNTKVLSTSELNNSKSVVKTGKSNFKVLDSNLSNIEYTYDKDGKSYKVLEKINSQLTDGQSEIYVKNQNGEYELNSKIITTVRDKKVTFTTTDVKGKIVNTDSVDLNELANQGKIDLNNAESTGSKNINTSSAVRVSIAKTASSSLTDWKHSKQNFGSNIIARYTIVGVTAVLCGVIGTLGGAVTAGVVSGLSAVVGMIVSEEIPRVYYGQDVYYKYIKGTYLPRAERTWTTFYSDSARKHKIKNTVMYQYYVRGWS